MTETDKQTDWQQWREELPSEPGWYWIDDGEEPSFSPRMVQVRSAPEDLEGEESEEGGEDEDAQFEDAQFKVVDPLDPPEVLRSFKDYDNPKWAGPIPKPTK